jgi:hypothetical protein
MEDPATDVLPPGFGEFTDDSQAAAWTGVLGTDEYNAWIAGSDRHAVSMFFLTQFATSLLWVCCIIEVQDSGFC